MEYEEYIEAVQYEIEERDDFILFIEIVKRRKEECFISKILNGMSHLGFVLQIPPKKLAELIVISAFKAEEEITKKVH